MERFVIIRGCFCCGERKILMKNFLIYLIIKWTSNNGEIVKTLVEGATDLLEM